MTHRVLLVSHAYPPASHAGVEVYSSRLAAELVRRGHEVCVCTARLRPGGAQYALEESTVDGIPTFGIVQNWPYRDLPEALEDPAVDRVFARVLDRVRPDLVAVQTLAGLSLGILDVLERAGVRHVVHLHDGWWACPSGGQRRRMNGDLCLPVDRRRCGACFARYRRTEGPVEAWSRRAAARLPGFMPPDLLHRAWNRLPHRVQDVVRTVNERRTPAEAAPVTEETDPAIEARAARVAEVFGRVPLAVSPTRFLADSLAADGVVARHTRVVPTGVPHPHPATAAGDHGGPLRLLFLGTWVPHKGLDVLARALADLPESTASRVVARAHGPVPFPTFRSEVLERARGRLMDAGRVPPGAVPKALADADVVVVPSIWAENAPLVALEARASGRVVLASDLGGLPELVGTESGGETIPGGDVEAWSAAIARLAEDRAELRRRAAASRAHPPRNVATWVDDVLDAWEFP